MVRLVLDRSRALRGARLSRMHASLPAGTAASTAWSASRSMTGPLQSTLLRHAVSYFSEQLSAELGKAPSVATMAKLVSTVRVLAPAATVAALQDGLACAAVACFVCSHTRAAATHATFAMLPAVQMNYQNKDNLVGAMIVAGYDDLEGGQVRRLWPRPTVQVFLVVQVTSLAVAHTLSQAVRVSALCADCADRTLRLHTRPREPGVRLPHRWHSHPREMGSGRQRLNIHLGSTG